MIGLLTVGLIGNLFFLPALLARTLANSSRHMSSGGLTLKSDLTLRGNYAKPKTPSSPRQSSPSGSLAY